MISEESKRLCQLCEQVKPNSREALEDTESTGLLQEKAQRCGDGCCCSLVGHMWHDWALVGDQTSHQGDERRQTVWKFGAFGSI